MKELFRIIMGVLAILAFVQCGVSQVFQTDPPFQLGECHIEPWTAGSQKQYQGVNLFFPVTSGKEVVLDTVYFARKKAFLQRIERDSYLVYKAVIDTTNEPYDVIMHADPREEFGNRPPKPGQTAFELSGNEAVVSYLEGGSRKYYKVTGLVLAPGLHYNQRPRVKN